jgi:serine/threonine protein kinase
MAPEMIKDEGYNFLADYYSLGTLLYEMLTGFPPFTSKQRSEIYN